MESTGKYWIPVYNILESDCSIVLAHPKYVKAIRGKKTDKKDAKWIADLFKHDLVAGSFMPPADIRQLRDLMRYRFKLTCFKSSEKNRLQNCLTVSNIQLGNVVSDTFGKSAQAILDKLLENPADTSFDLEPLIFRSLKNSFLRSPLPISRNFPFFKPLLVSAVFSLLSESFPRSVPIWRLFLRRNTYAHGLVLPQPTMKVQGRKNLFGFPRPDAISNRF